MRAFSGLESWITLLANDINNFFQSVSDDLPPLATERYTFPEMTDVPDNFLVSVKEVERQLMKVKPGKAPGCDNIQSWMLRDLTGFFAPPPPPSRRHL